MVYIGNLMHFYGGNAPKWLCVTLLYVYNFINTAAIKPIAFFF